MKTVGWWTRTILGLLMSTSCSDEPIVGSSAETETGKVGGEISFRALLADEKEQTVRGVPVAGTAYPDGASFGVLAYRLAQGEWRNTLLPDFMYNRKITRQGEHYLYTGVEYWPTVPVRFFAYHPYISSGNGIELSRSDYAGDPYLRFTVSDTVVRQVDLLLAAPRVAWAPLSTVFSFRHGLTRVAFWVNKSSGAGEVKVTSITLKNIVGAGEVSLVPSSGDLFEWKPSGRFEDVTEYVLSTPTPDGTERGIIAPDDQHIATGEYQNICSPNGTLFLIPQQITAGRSLLIVRYSVNGGEHSQEVLLPATSSGSSNEWLGGRFIRYQLTIHPVGATEEVELSVADASANCILLSPVPRRNPAAAHIEYSIPVQHANVFYTDPAFHAWAEEASGLSATDLWGVNVIWMDKANLLSIVKRQGQGTDDRLEGRFIVRIPAGNEGNALVGIFKDVNSNGVKDDGEEWLWSWHLWVTGYDPNRLLAPGTLSPSSAEGSWDVVNGRIHRYRNAVAIPDTTYNNGQYGSTKVWTPLTGLYAGKAIMDRNLGSVSDEFPSLESNVSFGSANLQQRKTPLHVLYYEYGRKDPFLSDAYRYQENGTALNTIDFHSLQVSLLFSIRNPEKYVRNRQSWAINKPTNCYWYDPRHKVNSQLSDDTGKKSLFDPCPVGWRLPVNGTWSDYSLTTFRWSSDRRGRTYTPANSTLEVFYPAEGFRAASSGEVKQTGYHGIYWTCSPIPLNDRDYCFRFSSPENNVLEGNVLLNTVYPSAAVYQTDSFSVRCVQE